MIVHTSRRCLGLLLALDILGLLTPSTARAGLLPLNFPNGAAIISGSNGGLTYNSTTGDFNVTLTGPSLVYAAPFVKPRGFTPIVNGSLSIDLVVDKSGKFVSNGKGLELTGTATINGATFGGNNNPLLLGTITDFGSEAAGPPTRTFDGFFTITGGALTQTETGSGGNAVFDGFPLGGSGGFLLSAENVTSGTLGDFSRNFSSSSVKPEVGPVVPEPSSLVLLLRAAVVLPAWGLRRKCLPASAAG